MEVKNSKADDQMGVWFCSSNEKDLIVNQVKDGYDTEDKMEKFEKLLGDGLSSDEIPNKPTQPFQMSDLISRNNTEMSLEKKEKETEKSVVDQYGVSDFSKRGLHQISPQLLPRLAAVQMLYLQVTLL